MIVSIQLRMTERVNSIFKIITSLARYDDRVRSTKRISSPIPYMIVPPKSINGCNMSLIIKKLSQLAYIIFMTCSTIAIQRAWLKTEKQKDI